MFSVVLLTCTFMRCLHSCMCLPSFSTMIVLQPSNNAATEAEAVPANRSHIVSFGCRQVDRKFNNISMFQTDFTRTFDWLDACSRYGVPLGNDQTLSRLPVFRSKRVMSLLYGSIAIPVGACWKYPTTISSVSNPNVWNPGGDTLVLNQTNLRTKITWK